MKKVRLRTRNFSCKKLSEIPCEIPTIIRFGSTTPSRDIIKKGIFKEINSAEACKMSSNKYWMKKRLLRGRIPTAELYYPQKNKDIEKILCNMILEGNTIIAKHVNSSKGKGIYLLKNNADILLFLKKHKYHSYIFERFYSYSKEYRIHATQKEVFLAHRKMLKTNAPDRWRRHSDNSIWIKESNDLFDKPNNWEDIKKTCIDAIKSVGLDIGCVDIKVQTKKDNPKYIILETNSAPAMGEETLLRYEEEIKKLIL